MTNRKQKVQAARVQLVQDNIADCVAGLSGAFSIEDVAVGLSRALIAAMKRAGMTDIQISNELYETAQHIRAGAFK